jgi:hypothetical protein
MDEGCRAKYPREGAGGGTRLFDLRQSRALRVAAVQLHAGAAYHTRGCELLVLLVEARGRGCR